ncbi:MAG: hypothetical protein K0R28_5162, partial [Paenibacillus sp.]|nr:hypothetical protein [Paenibacillus sp.]
MQMKKGYAKSIGTVTTAVLLASLAAACGGGDTASKEGAQPAGEVPARKEPVEIVFYSPNAGRTPEQFMSENGNDIKQKFPHVTVKFV